MTERATAVERARECVGIVAISTLQTVFGWLLVAGFAVTSGAAFLGSLAAWYPAITGTACFFVIFVVAPYQIWLDEANRADVAEALLQPHLDVSAEVVRGGIPKDGRIFNICVLHLRNTSGGSIEDCEVMFLGARVELSHGAWHDAGVLPFLIRWPDTLGGGERLTFHDQAYVRLFARNTRGKAHLRFFDALSEKPGGHSLGEFAKTHVDLSVAARGSVRWRGTLEVSVDPLGARTDQYIIESGGIGPGEEVEMGVQLIDVDDSPLLLKP